MHPRRRSFRPRLEQLEGREVPTNLAVIFSPTTHTLTVVGDADNNTLNAEGDATDPTRYYLSSPSDTINGQSVSYHSPPGMRNIVIRMLGGDDAVSFDNTSVPGSLAGSLSVNGGDGANVFRATHLAVDGNLSITNGTNAAGDDLSQLYDLSVKGNVTVRNAGGLTATQFFRVLNGNSTIGGNLTVTNGTGADEVGLADTDVGGNVTINNGHGGANGAPSVLSIFDNVIADRRSVIRGNLTVTYLDGSGENSLLDAEVGGNVTFNEGPGQFRTVFDATNAPAPVLVRGSLKIRGAGSNEVDVGSPAVVLFGRGLGLVVGGNFTMANGAGSDVLHLNQLQVGGATRLALGDGFNRVFIDDSRFAGAFTLTTGSGQDVVFVETVAGTEAPTEFGGPVTMSLGLQDDLVVLGPFPDALQSDPQQLVIVDGTFLIHHGGQPGDDSESIGPGHVVFPFGTSVQWVE